MAQLLQIPNFPLINQVEAGNLLSLVQAGDTALQTVNSNSFDTGSTLYLGNFGSETGEVVTALDVTSQNMVTLNQPGAKFSHPPQEPVTRLFGTYLKIWRAPYVANVLYPTDSAFTLVTTASLDADQALTEVTDPDGGSGFWYKVTYSNGTNETNLSDSVAKRGGSGSEYCSIEDIRFESGFKNGRWITNDRVARVREEAQAVVNDALGGLYMVPFTAPISPHIQLITKMLAAGYLLIQEYPGSDLGKEKIEMVTSSDPKKPGYLDKLQSKQTVLKDAVGTGTATPGAGSGSAGGFPDAVSANAGYNDNGFAFRRSQTASDYSRFY